MTYAKDMAVDASLAPELRTTVMRLARRMRSERPDDSLTLSQIAALGTVLRHGPMTPSELAAHEKVQPPSMTRIIAKLDEHGYVARTPDPTDGRQVVVSATAEGRALLADDRRRKDKWLSLRLTTLSSADRAALATALPVLEQLSRS